MRIGVDARILSEQFTGIGRYTLSLLREMIPSGYEWILYSHRPLFFDFSMYPNVILKNHSFSTRVARMIWSQTVLPIWANMDSVDLFWSPGHRLPLLLSSKITSVVTIHDLVWKHAPQTMRKLSRFLDATLMPRAIKMADAIIAVSKQTSDDIVRELPVVDGKNIHVVYEGVNLAKPSSEESLEQYGLKTKSYLLFVGTLEPRKNLRRLLEAYAGLENKIQKQFCLVIAGGKGWGKENVVDLIQQYGLAEFVRVLGYINDDMLSTLYRHAVMLTMPSLFEGFGLPIVEAMSFGTPVMTSNVSSMPEIAGDVAVLVDPSDVQSIKNGMESILKNLDLRKKLIEKGRQRAALFTWEKAAEETLKVFEKAFYEKQSVRKN